MATDNWPVDFRYVSKRLVTQIVQQDQAVKPRKPTVFTIPFGSFSLALQRREPDYGNPFDLARRATEAVSDWTGSLDAPGRYVRAQANLDLCTITVLQGFDRPHVEIAAIFADVTTTESGRCFMALFGSLDNYTHIKPKADDGCGLYPSDVDGLYSILDGVLEASDPKVDRDYLWRDAGIETRARQEVAHEFFESTRRHSFRTEFLDVLAWSFGYDEDVDLGGSRYDSVLIGAPVWIATTGLSTTEK